MRHHDEFAAHDNAVNIAAHDNAVATAAHE
jgi:hypothetical protein